MVILRRGAEDLLNVLMQTRDLLRAYIERTRRVTIQRALPANSSLDERLACADIRKNVTGRWNAPLLKFRRPSGRVCMSEKFSYRAYFLSASDHIRDVRGFKAADDASACTEAELMLERSEHAAIEVYEGWRLVWAKQRADRAAA